jgi:hypothetical protein
MTEDCNLLAEYWDALEEVAAQPNLAAFAGCKGLVQRLAEHAQYRLLSIALCQVRFHLPWVRVRPVFGDLASACIFRAKSIWHGWRRG